MIRISQVLVLEMRLDELCVLQYTDVVLCVRAQESVCLVDDKKLKSFH